MVNKSKTKKKLLVLDSYLQKDPADILFSNNREWSIMNVVCMYTQWRPVVSKEVFVEKLQLSCCIHESKQTSRNFIEIINK